MIFSLPSVFSDTPGQVEEAEIFTSTFSESKMSGIFSTLSLCQKMFRGISGSRFLHKEPIPLQNTEGSKNKPPVLTLSPGAIYRHIYPDCKDRKDAERFSEARFSEATVLVADVKDFYQDGKCVVSNIRVPYYDCRYNKMTGYFQVLESYFVLYVCIYQYLF